MLTQGRFLISYQVFDNIPVNNIGQTHVREILKDTQILYHCQILWMGTKRGRPRGNHFQYILFRYSRR